ncbi:MAG TPA: hypothetical protein VHP33_12875 [Polyangiaceae bacterium]|nr:hypothetical protein [Polyangiaceae bacterium]
MNIKHSVNVPALSGKRSMLRRLVTAATMGALMLGVVSASADGGGGRGKFKLEGSASGGIAVKGSGNFKIRDVDGKLIFDSKVGGCTDIVMDDGRQDHTCKIGKTKINGMEADSVAKLVVEKSAIKFPEAGKSSSGSAPGKLHFLKKSSDVTVEYKISESGGKYKVSEASFKFDYTKHTNEVCLAVVCVKPEFKVTVKDAEIDAKK